MSAYAPCPKCSGTNSEEVRFTWWGGVLGPKLLNHVKCQACGSAYNGKTGKSNTSAIIMYSVVVGVATLILIIIAAVLGAFR